MMHLVTYTLEPKRDATRLFEELQRSAGWWHNLDDTWLVLSNETAEQLWNRLAPHFVATDKTLIIHIAPEAEIPSGWLPAEAWKWINEHRDL